MTDPSLAGLRSVLAAALRARIPEGGVDRTLALYIALALAANDRGRVIRTRDRLASELSASASAIDEGLARLTRSGLIAITSPSPYLVIRLRFWPGASSSPAPKAPESGSASGSSMRVVPVSKLLAAAATPGVAAACGEGGAGEGAALLAEAREALGREAGDDLPALLARYPVPVARRAVRRVRLTPRSRIRASKSALLRFLLEKFSHEPHVPSPRVHDHA